jgi:WD40 repeat protein
VYQTFKHKSEVYFAVFSPNGLLVVTATRNGLATIWDIKDGKKPLGSCEGHQGRASSIAFAKGDSSHFATVGQDGSAKIWNWNGKVCALVRSIETLHGWTYSVAISSDGKSMVTAGKDGFGRIWDIASGRQLKMLGAPVLGPRHEGWIYRVTWKGNRIASAGKDGTVRVWDSGSGKQVSVVNGPSGWWVYSVDISEDGNRMAIASEAPGWAFVYGREYLESVDDLKTQIRLRNFTDKERLEYHLPSSHQ